MKLVCSMGYWFNVDYVEQSGIEWASVLEARGNYFFSRLCVLRLQVGVDFHAFCVLACSIPEKNEGLLVLLSRFNVVTYKMYKRQSKFFCIKKYLQYVGVSFILFNVPSDKYVTQ